VSLGADAPVRRMALVRRKAEGDKRVLDLVQAAFVRAAEGLREWPDAKSRS